MIQRSILEHEFTHIKKQHSKLMILVRDIILEKTGLKIKNPILPGLKMMYYTIRERSIDTERWYKAKLSRAQKAEAYRESIACRTYENARSSYIIEKICVEIDGPNAFTYLKDPEHPPTAKRAAWKALIMFAKQAEERLNVYENSYRKHYSIH